ncbi:uncharacterized protein LOC116853355 isoform X2 [Odontomachus brunneus]|uniref:uncharacterized protein LOC116853355 isoform X2 n=1 Tax=Odontomachus brunneus TaxID=486640 RepID=UPI0013F1E343|nr:uncharacterized protein LOC116853355 isoform X2 [Odontomachus brunneus]
MEQQSESNQSKNWYPRTIFNRSYHNYAVVVMARSIYWEPRKMFEIWKEAVLTVTVNGGIYSWIQYLENAGIDIFSGQYNEYVPKIIIAKRMDRSIHAPLTMIDKLKSLGSRVIYLPGQNRKEFTRTLNCIADFAHDSNMTLRDMYAFAESEANFHNVQVIETLRVSDGNIRNIEIVIVSSFYFCWMLRHGLHKIRVENGVDKNMVITICSFLPFNSCVVNNLTTTGLQTNFSIIG